MMPTKSKQYTSIRSYIKIHCIVSISLYKFDWDSIPSRYLWLPHLPCRHLHTVRVFGFHQREVKHGDNSNEWNTSVLDVDAHTCRSGDANATMSHFGATRSSGTPTTPAAAAAPASSSRPIATMSLFRATHSSGRSTIALGDQQESSLPINETNER